jgi:hypothetical protein
LANKLKICDLEILNNNNIAYDFCYDHDSSYTSRNGRFKLRLIYYYQSLDIESTNTPPPFLLAVLAMGIVGIEIGEII